MAKKMGFTVTLHFQDGNMPKMRQDEKTLELAKCTMAVWAGRFASVKMLVITDWMAKEKHVYAPGGGYMFTLPLL